MFAINNLSEHQMINDRQYRNILKLNKTSENIVKNSKKNISNFVIENSDKLCTTISIDINNSLYCNNSIQEI